MHPTAITDAGYRLYDDTALERLQQIMLFRELEFSLKDIKVILDSPDFDRNKALEQQIELLLLRKEHLENLIDFARGIQGIGVKHMDFKAFDTRKIDEYAAQAKATWGQTKEYQEFEERSKDWTDEHEKMLSENFMKIFEGLGKMKEMNAASEQVQEQIKRLQDFITENFYTCSNEILLCLGKMYSGGGSLSESIDAAGGAGTAEFVGEAIRVYCG